MNGVDELIKKAQKEFQKIRIQIKGLIAVDKSRQQRTQLEKTSKHEVATAKQALSKNSSALKGAIKSNFAHKLTEVFEEQKRTLDSI